MTTSAPLTPQDVREAAAMVCETVGQRWHGTQLEDACDECAGAIRAMELPPSTGWQPIETAPRDGRAVLGYVVDSHAYGDCPVIVSWCNSREEWNDYFSRRVLPTHWQPLPAPPETTP